MFGINFTEARIGFRMFPALRIGMLLCILADGGIYFARYRGDNGHCGGARTSPPLE